jgi:hypothetical protein
VTDLPGSSEPFKAEDGAYIAIVDEYRGLRRAGAGMVDAALLTSALRVLMMKAKEDAAAVAPA